MGAASAQLRAFAHSRPKLILVVLALLVYAPSVPLDFAYDDTLQILNNPQVSAATFSWASFARLFTEPTPGAFYRPLGTLSYWATYLAAGPTPWVFHLQNVLLFAACTALVYAVCARLANSKTVGLWAGVLFAVHPVHVEAVANIIGRIELLACVFSLAVLLVGLKGREWGYGPRYSASAAALMLLAMLSKESGFTTLAILPFCVGVPLWAPMTGRNLRDVVVRTAPAVVGAATALALRYLVLGDRFFQASTHAVGVHWENPLLHLSGVDRLFGAVMVLGEYLRLLVLPIRLSADYSMMPADFLARLYSPHGVTSIVLVLAAAAATVVMRRAAAGVFLLWFFAAFSVTSNVFVMNSTVMGERLAFTPSVGFLAFVAAVLCGPRMAKYRWVLVAVAAAFLVRTEVRIPVWRNNEVLFTRTLTDIPWSPKAHYNLGVFYLDERGDARRAKPHFEAVLGFYPDHVLSLMCLGDIASGERDFDAMERYYRRVLELAPAQEAVRRELERYEQHKRQQGERR